MMPWQKRVIYGNDKAKWKPNKYGARKVMVGGNVFDSAKEAARFRDLKQQEVVGFISNLELQPCFVLQEGFTHGENTYKPIEYYADFRYVNKEGKVIVEDTKGFRTETYLLKKKMLLKKYPDINFRET